MRPGRVWEGSCVMKDKLLQTKNDGGSFSQARRHWRVTEAVITLRNTTQQPLSLSIPQWTEILSKKGENIESSPSLF